MESVFFIIAVLSAYVAYRCLKLPDRVKTLEDTLARTYAEQLRLREELAELRREMARQRPTDQPLPVPVTLAPARPVAPAPEPAAAPASPMPTPAAKPEPVRAPQPVPVPAPVFVPPPVVPPPAAPRPVPPAAPPVPAGPTWWERTERLLLENWTGILGAVILVTGVGFLGIYTALRISAFYRFFLITGFAGLLLGVQFYLRTRPFAAQLSVWLQSSAAAIFLFACVGAAALPGLRWATSPFDYLLLFIGVALNLYLAWVASRETVATLHGVLSLIALAVLPSTALTLGAAAVVTVFSIAITYRQRWKYQLLLSILSFALFHLYWHQHMPGAGANRLIAIGLLVLVGVAAAVVQYRRLYAHTRFDGLLFAAHLLNWTCLGLGVYLHSTGSPWKTVPLGLGAVLVFFLARYARRLGIQWLFQTDTIIALVLGLAAAFSLLGWRALPGVVLLFMLLEFALVAFIMAREREALVFRLASAGLILASAGLLVLNLASFAQYAGPELYRNAVILFLAGLAATVYYRFTAPLPLLDPAEPGTESHQPLLRVFGVLGVLLLAGAGLLLTYGLFHLPAPPALLLTGALLGMAGVAVGLAYWLPARSAGLRSLHLVLTQLLVGLTIISLHKLHLSWPVVGTLLYLESLAFGLWLAYRRELPVLRVQTYLLLALGVVLPAVVYSMAPAALTSGWRTLLLLGAALATIGYAGLLHRLDAPAYDELPLSSAFRLRLLGLLTGWLLLMAGTYQYQQTWTVWVAVLLGAALLLIRQHWRVPGLWAGLLLAIVGYHGLQWLWVENTAAHPGTGATLLHLLPLAVLSGVGLYSSWSATAQRYVRFPWIYLFGLHLAFTVHEAFGRSAGALVPGLLWLGLALAMFLSAEAVRTRFPSPATLARQGYPDRFMLHVAYALLGAFLLRHFTGYVGSAQYLLGLPVGRVAAGAGLTALLVLASRRAPAGEPQYRSWRYAHPLLLEAGLLLLAFTIWWEVSGQWLALTWVVLALLAEGVAPRLARFGRLAFYGRLFYWAAAATSSWASLQYLPPARLISPVWGAAVAAVALLFAYVFYALRRPGPAAYAFPHGLQWLQPQASLDMRRLVPTLLLYPAFTALTVLLVQSFDRSILTVLLTLEVFAVFGASLLLRRKDLRYAALGGAIACIIRLLFFDLSQSNTITRAIVFIFVGLLFLGMSALFARYKDRFQPAAEPAEPANADSAD
ncbi:DUF2339 domain-containing protein [Hymenobacter sp. BT175]|uniref:DUF2339 domain-containing protein n=1 Tax=Hymenobacter translucens TaxID=2886507 RepID=UPI001D0DC763|nr:DUF2339 domain-containing protein [Hymenobacter translucens]MCC2548011.1 DUF2339 domain-containing protein [Hymenobacter translucens]